jgi:hypothetical protein
VLPAARAGGEPALTLVIRTRSRRARSPARSRARSTRSTTSFPSTRSARWTRRWGGRWPSAGFAMRLLGLFAAARAAALRGRHLGRDRLQRLSADPGDRHPHGARRAASRRPPHAARRGRAASRASAWSSASRARFC